MASHVAPLACSDQLRERVLAQLQEILASPSFRTSPRSQQFIRYVVTESLEGRGDQLKERVIGEQVFHREPNYDTGQDSIVRVKANEVRRRLAQYYEQHPGLPLKIEMASGSYGIHIREPEVPVVMPESLDPEVSERIAGRRWWYVAAACAGLAVVVAIAGFGRQSAPLTTLTLFWQPFLAQASEPLLLCMPAPEAFRIYGQGKDELVRRYASRPPGAAPAQLSAGLTDVRVVPEPGLLVGLGDAEAMAMVRVLAARYQREVKVRPSGITSFSDLSSGPGVIIGGETNQWNAEMAKGIRFAHAKVEGRSVIVDRTTNQPVCTKPASWEPRGSQDCAVITRLRRAPTGQPLLMAAGLDHYGTFALGNFLTEGKALDQALQDQPAGWEERNLQILLKVAILRDGVGAPQVHSIHVW